MHKNEIDGKEFDLLYTAYPNEGAHWGIKSLVGSKNPIGILSTFSCVFA